MYHPRLKGTHYDMGRKMGSIFRAGNVRFPIRLDPFQKKFGRESGRLLSRYFPEAAEEIRGITDAMGLDNEILTSWMMCMGCCLYNLDEENSVETRGCTAFAFVGQGADTGRGGEVFYGRDNDLPPFLKKPSKSVYYAPAGGNRFILNTSSFINGEEGINEHGLTAAMTFVLPRMDEILPGINSVFLVRYILEKCATVQDGLDALAGLPIASSCNILLADPSGAMAVAECNPIETRLRHPEETANGSRFIVTVNHFTSDEMRKHDAGDRNLYFSDIRYRTAFEALGGMDFTDGAEHARKILRGDYGFMCQYDRGLNFETIWSSVFDLKRGRVFRAEGDPRKTPFVEDRRLTCGSPRSAL